jgi:hypothetical protein
MFDVHFLVNPSYETSSKWHGFLMIKLAAFQASGAYMKFRMRFRLTGTVNR